MKKIILTAALLASCLMFKANAQVHISLGVNIGSQPAWGPVGYDHASYYYMPDIDSYYDVSDHQYICYQNSAWIRLSSLPSRYGRYDLYNSYKVVINERNPWERNRVYRTRYADYRDRHDQEIIRDSREQKYRNHWQDDRGRGPGNSDYGHDRQDHGNGHGNGRGNGNDNGDNGHGNGNGHGRGHDDN